MSKIRKSAKSKQCAVRVPNVCNHDPDTTVFAHLGGGGMALKQSDLFGAYTCSLCHAAIDGAMPTIYTKDELKLMHLQGIVRTQQILLNDGLIKID